MGNIFNDNSTNQYNTDLILEPLESLKSKIISIVNNSYKEAYYKIRTPKDLFNWKNKIIV